MSSTIKGSEILHLFLSAMCVLLVECTCVCVHTHQILHYLKAKKLVCHSFMCTEDMRFLGQKQRSLLLTAIAVSKVSVLYHFLKPQFLQGNLKRDRWQLHTWWIIPQERKPESRETKYFIMGSMPTLPLPWGIYYLYYSG